jgi:hypothetical protein
VRRIRRPAYGIRAGGFGGEFMELKDLVGEHELSGVDTGILHPDPDVDRWGQEDANTLLFILDGVTYYVVEDASDGYRSSMKDIQIVSDRSVANRFQPVRVNATHEASRKGDWSTEECDLLTLTDVESGKVVLEVGTLNSDDYYPSFVGNWLPQNLAVNQAQGGA